MAIGTNIERQTNKTKTAQQQTHTHMDIWNMTNVTTFVWIIQLSGVKERDYP